MMLINSIRWRLLWALLVLVAAGCASKEPAADTKPKAPPPPLRLLVVDDPGLAKIIKREWEARSEGELTLKELTADELLKIEQRRLGTDAVIYPSGMIGDLAARDWLMPLPKDRLDDSSYASRDIFAATRKQELVWEEGTEAVPLGGPQLMLFYRRDIFEKLSLKLPQTWKEYHEIGQRLGNRQLVQEFLPSAEAAWHGVAEPLADRWAAQLLLARAAPYAKHRSQFSALFDYRTMKPLIAGPPFVRALGELSDSARLAPSDRQELTPTGTIQLLLDGKCGMALGWLVNSDAWGSKSSESRTGPPPDIAVAPLPGSRDVYNFRSESWEQRSTDESFRVPLVGIAGRLGSVTKECRQPAETVRLLLWLAGPEMSAQISAASPETGPFRQIHVSQIYKWTGALVARNWLSQETAKQYAEAQQQSLSEPNSLVGLRIPGRQKYLQSLADNIQKAVAGEASAEDALQEVARQWQELNESLGLEKQRLAYAQSIGLRP